MATPIQAALDAVADVWEATTPAGDRPTFGYKRAGPLHGAHDPANPNIVTLSDRMFTFEQPEEIEGDIGLGTVLQGYLVRAYVGIDTADLSSQDRAGREAEHLSALRRAVDKTASWPAGVQLITTEAGESLRTDDGHTILEILVEIHVWET